MLNSEKIYEILNSYNRFWSSGKIDAGIRRDILDRFIRQFKGKEVIVISGVRRSGKSTLMAQMIQALMVSGGEIDFVIKEGTLIAAHIQVWYKDPRRDQYPTA